MTAVPRRAPVPAGLALLLAFLPSPLSADPGGPSAASPDRLKAQAAEHERKGRWEAAFQAYCQLLTGDRANAEYREKLQLCLRHALQDRRLRDASIQDRLLSLPHSQALALYGEAVSKIQAHYVDREKSLPTRLFQQGLEELDNALGDDAFRQKYLKDAPEGAVRQFRQKLREAWADRAVASTFDAQTFVGEIALAARRDLRFQKVNAVVLEFLCGACNSLDEFSAYLSPGQLIAELENPDVPSVTDAAVLKDGVAYARVAYFRDSTAQELDSALAGLRMAAGGGGIRSLILDLRGNPGGSFAAAVQVAERFLPQGVIVTTHGQLADYNKVYTSVAGGSAIDWRLYVLVDGETASAAEVLAGALRDHQRATLVGTPTFGKGTIQVPIQFTTGQDTDDQGKPRPRAGGVRITLARVFSPNGQALSGGITPHVVEPDKGRQLDAALEDAARFASMMMTRPQ